jgi:hypothetical protein
MISEGSHGAPFDNLEPGGINYVEDPGYQWLWLIPTVLLIVLVIGLWYGGTF